MEISAWIKEAFQLYKENFGVLLVAGFLTGVVSLISLGILAGPLSAGLYLIIFRLIDKSEPAPSVMDVFKGLNKFLQTFAFFVGLIIVSFAVSALLQSIPGIGGILSFLGSIFLATLLMFGLPLIAEHDMDALTAAKTSVDTTMKNIFPYAGFFALAYLIGVCGVLAFGIGVIITIPYLLCAIGVAYRKTFSA